jgi:outer membrane protein assembly factor BamB
MVKICLAAACLVVLFGGICAAEPGGVMWTARYMEDQSGWAQAVSCLGSRVYTAGRFWPPDEYAKGRFALAAYDTKTGTPVWAESGTEGTLARTVKAVAGRVYTAGTLTNAPVYPMFIKAFNATNGRPAWERSWPDGDSAIPNGLALDAYATKIFVAGTRVEPDQTEGFFSVLALNNTKGNILWEQSKDGSRAKKGNAMAITVNAGRVFVVGTFYDDADYRDGFAVRAYNTTGHLLWEDVQWSEGTGSEGARLHSYATAVTATASRVYVAGSINGRSGGGNFTIRVYNAATGKVVWEDQYNHHKYFHDAAYSVLLQGTRVFVGGFVTRPSAGRAYTVRAYDAAKGTLLWSNMDGGYNIEENGVSALTAVDGTVYGAGTAKDGSAFTIRAYKATTGDILWENFLPQEGVLGGFGDAFAICATGGRVFTGGAAMVDDTSYAFTVRAYSVH